MRARAVRGTAIRRLLCYGLVAAWLVVIWQFGQSRVLPLRSGDLLTWLVRKGLHLVIYGVFGGLLALTAGSRRRWGWIIAVCFLVALGDELHQWTVPRRTFRIGDVGIDFVGGLLGAFVERLVSAPKTGRSSGPETAS